MSFEKEQQKKDMMISMGLFDDEDTYSGDKKCVYEKMLLTESAQTLKEFLKFEDLCIGGYNNNFPDRIAYKWADVLEVERLELERSKGN